MLANDIRNYRAADSLYIAHHGILGMKWGIRRFQNPDGTRTAAGKARYNEGGDKPSNPVKAVGDAIKKRKTDKQRKAALEKARQAKATKAAEAKSAEEREAERKKALESGDYKQIQKYANESSTAELKSAMERANTLNSLNQKVDETTPKEKDIWSAIDDVANKVGSMTNAVDKSKNAWNTMAKIYNTFVDEDNMLPELGTNFAEQKEKKRKEREENERKAKVEELQKSLDPKKIMDNQKIFTKNELQDANNRIVTYNQLKEKQDKIDAEKQAEKDRKKAEKEEKKAAKEFEKSQAQERAKNDYLDDIEMSKYNLGGDNSSFGYTNPKPKEVKEAYDYFDNDTTWSKQTVESASKDKKSKKGTEVVSHVYDYLNNYSQYNASSTVNNWNSVFQSSVYDYE